MGGARVPEHDVRHADAALTKLRIEEFQCSSSTVDRPHMSLNGNHDTYKGRLDRKERPSKEIYLRLSEKENYT